MSVPDYDCHMAYASRHMNIPQVAFSETECGKERTCLICLSQVPE